MKRIGSTSAKYLRGILTGLTIAVPGSALLAQQVLPAITPPTKGGIVPPRPMVDPNLQQVQQPSTSLTQPESPEASLPTPSAPTGPQTPSTASPLGSAAPSTPAGVAEGTPSGLTASIDGAQSFGRATTDAGDLLGRSLAGAGVETQKRSPIVNEPRVRGYRIGQIVTHADGAFWFPARQDLDTFFSKIDSGVVQDVTVIKGPYSVRYGPGLSFIDITTLGSPRYECGLEFHGSTSSIYKFNGEQLYGRQSLWGGAENYGTRFSYGQRTGNDYQTGQEDLEMPSSYNSRDVTFVYGMDLSPNSRIEFGYLRLDQTVVEFPGQVFDTDFLVTNGYRARYVLENQQYFDELVVDAFYNRTNLAGTAQRPSKRVQIPQLDALQLNGFTDIDQSSAGTRIAFTWGLDNCPQLTVGTDLRQMRGQLNEFTAFGGLGLDHVHEDEEFCQTCALLNSFPIPRNHHTTYGGLFVEYVLPLHECLKIKTGARGDYVNADIVSLPPGFTSPEQIAQRLGVNSTDFQAEFGLVMGYLTAEYKYTKEITLTAGVGHGERAPTPTELYALGPFLAILQQGTTAVLGDPNLDQERLWQVDVGLRADYEHVRAGAAGFYAWIEDYITYAALSNVKGADPNSGGGVSFGSFGQQSLLVRFANTPLATLFGGEAYFEFDYNPWLTPFVTVMYVQGEDHTRDHRGNPIPDAQNAEPGVGALGPAKEPLPMIPPLEARIGFRFHEDLPDPNWAIEFMARAVNRQDRVAGSLLEFPTAGFTVYDVRAYWRPHQQLTLTFGTENVFDLFYQEHLDLRTGRGVFQPGRNVYLGAEVRY